MIEKIISLWRAANGQIWRKFLFYTVSTIHTNCYNQIERKKCSSVEKWNRANKMVSFLILTNSYAIWSNRRLIMAGQNWWRFLDLVLRFTLDRFTEPLVRDLHEWLPLFRSSGVYKSFDLKINSDVFKIKMTCVSSVLDMFQIRFVSWNPDWRCSHGSLSPFIAQVLFPVLKTKFSITKE